MGEFFKSIQFQFNQFFSRLSGQQKIILGIVAVGSLALIFVLLIWTSSTPFESLYTELSQKDAAEIVEKLRARNVEYKIQDGGKVILVPSAKIYELRLDLAQEGLPESGFVGYELLDNQELGVTEFRQKVAYKRALEGELARTIKSIEIVDKANVLIVIPKERLFEKDQKVPTASVQLKLKNRSAPPLMTVEAIAHLVSSGVEGLEPENVTITDTRGRILSQNRNPASTLALSSNQLEFTRKVEQDLERKALGVLEKRVGIGNATVQVTAGLNWSQVEKTIQDVDPDRSVTISEEISEQSSPDPNSGSLQKSSNTITNFENSKSVQRIVEGVGNIKHLSVAVIVDNKHSVILDKDGKEQRQSLPRDAVEMQHLEELVKTAVGFLEDRDDQLTVVNMEFDQQSWENNPEDQSPWWGDPFDILEKILIIATVLVAFMIVRSLITQAKDRGEEIQTEIKKLKDEFSINQLSGAESAGALTEGQGEENDTLVSSEEFFKSAKMSNEINDKVRGYVKGNPQVANKLIKVWLMEDDD